MPNRNERAGRLDRQITLQRATTVADGYGTPMPTWTDLYRVWANLDYPATGSGEVQYDAVHLATTNAVFTIRYRADVLPTDRIAYNGQYYDITRIAETAGPSNSGGQNSTRRAFLALTAELRR